MFTAALFPANGPSLQVSFEVPGDGGLWRGREFTVTAGRRRVSLRPGGWDPAKTGPAGLVLVTPGSHPAP